MRLSYFRVRLGVKPRYGNGPIPQKSDPLQRENRYFYCLGEITRQVTGLRGSEVARCVGIFIPSTRRSAERTLEDWASIPITSQFCGLRERAMGLS